MNKRKLDAVSSGDSAETDEDGPKRARSDNDEEDDGGGGVGNHNSASPNVTAAVSTSPPHQQACCYSAPYRCFSQHIAGFA